MLVLIFFRRGGPRLDIKPLTSSSLEFQSAAKEHFKNDYESIVEYLFSLIEQD